jgi:hypothetical protein
VADDAADDVLDQVLAAREALGCRLDAEIGRRGHRGIPDEEIRQAGAGEQYDQGHKPCEQLEERLHRGLVLRDHSASTAGARVSMCHERRRIARDCSHLARQRGRYRAAIAGACRPIA